MPTDSAEFEEMVRPHLGYLYGLALRLSGPTDAEDLVQDGLLKAFRAFPGRRNRERPRLWLTRVITSCHHDRIRAGRDERQTVSLEGVAKLLHSTRQTRAGVTRSCGCRLGARKSVWKWHL